MSSGYGLAGGKDLVDLLRGSVAEPLQEAVVSAFWRSMANLSVFNTGPSRCFPFWQELLACYVVNTSTDDVSGAKKCLPVMEDYYECLHHKKEVSWNSRCLPCCRALRVLCLRTLTPNLFLDRLRERGPCNMRTEGR